MNYFMPKNILFIKLFLFGCLIFLSINTNAQTGIFFQAVARDYSSNPAKDRKIYVQTNIIQSSPTGTIVLAEEHQTNTDAHGVFSIMVGNGQRVGGTATGLSTIDWSKGPFYLNIKIAITPVSVGTTWDYRKEWVNLGTTIFGIVPYALFSASTARIDEKLNSIDTAKMLSGYAKALAVQALSTTIDTKLAIKDTAAMLAPYAKLSYKIDSNLFKKQLSNKLDLSDTIKYTKQAYTDSALLTKMNNFDTSIYAKQVTVDAALLKKMNNFDTSMYAKQVTVDAALLKKMNNFDTSIYAKQVTLDAALLKKFNNVDSINYTKKTYTDSALLTKMNSFDISPYAKQVTLDAALLTKLSLTGNALSATTAINAGTATTATKLTTARNINGVAFDGTEDITISTIADAGTLTGTILKSTVIGSSLTSVGTIASLTTGAITNSGKLIVGASSAASASAVLEASSTTQGFLPPRMTYYQRTQIASPIAGLTIWCSNCGDYGEMQVYNGTSWTNMIGRSASIYLRVGDVYQGGKVAYILVNGDPGYDATTQHGLIAATSDQSRSITWDRLTGEFPLYQGTNRGAIGTAIGTGFSNTSNIIASQGIIATNYAAGLARAYRGGGYTDWYLPSKDELNKLYLNRVAIGGFISNSNGLYWSSSEIQSYPYHSAWLQDFSNGGPLSIFKSFDFDVNVRAIRLF
jgi:hypothetical protein